MCKLGVNADLGLEVQSLCHLIPSHFDKETVAIILEQVLFLMPPYALDCYFSVFFLTFLSCSYVGTFSL